MTSIIVIITNMPNSFSFIVVFFYFITLSKCKGKHFFLSCK